MKKIIFFLPLVTLIVAIACNQGNNTAGDQDKILPLAQTAQYSISMMVNENSLPLLNGFDSAKFVANVIEKALSGKTKTFDFYTTGAVLLPKQINENFGVGKHWALAKNAKTGLADKLQVDFKLDPAEVKELAFVEQWKYDSTTFQILKEVKGFGPVRHFYGYMDLNKDTLLVKVPFMINAPDSPAVNGDTKNLVLLSQKAEYMVNIGSDSPLTKFDGFDGKGFATKMIENVLAGKIKVYDYFSDARATATIDQVKLDLGYACDTISVEDPETGVLETKVEKREIDYNEIIGLLFIEEWYFDDTNSRFVKKVAGLAPVRGFYREDGDTKTLIKKVPFVLYFDKAI